LQLLHFSDWKYLTGQALRRGTRLGNYARQLTAFSSFPGKFPVFIDFISAYMVK
jgi:hypothetical protein